MISYFLVCKVRDIFIKFKMFRALVLPIMEYCGAIWGPDKCLPLAESIWPDI
jgi:hypothetical protein